MNIVIAPDSFKESLTAQQVCQAIATGISRVFPDSELQMVPVADGGEGTVQSLIDATQGKIVELNVTGPLGSPVPAFYGLLGDGSETAVIEMAAASGLHYVPQGQRDPKLTTSYGTGELIKAALADGAKKIIIGLGGSATNDGGMGMLCALGVNFTDSEGNNLQGNGANLALIDNIDISNLDNNLKACEIRVACDVDNPLCGEKGASAIFGPQKGATADDIQLLDDALNHYATVIKTQLNKEVLAVPGAGAAGGMGAAFLAFTQATLKPGIELVLEAVQLQQYLTDADLVITGEGRIDGQTVHGKTPMGVAQLAKQYHLPVIGIAGSLGQNHQAVFDCGIDAVFAAVPGAMSLQEAFANAFDNVANVAENVMQLWKLKTTN